MKIERIDINDPNFDQKKLDDLVETINGLFQEIEYLEQCIGEL